MIESHFEDSAEVSAYVLGRRSMIPVIGHHHPHAPPVAAVAAKGVEKWPAAAIIVRPQPVSMDP